MPYFVVAMQRPVDKYLFDHPEIWEQNNQPRFDREPAFLAEVFRRYGSVERVLDVGCGTGGHLFFPQELRYFLETNAFRFLCFYGDFDVESTSLDGTRLIAVAQKL